MDRVCGLVVFFIGIGILWQGRNLSFGSFGVPGPLLFPFLLGLLLIPPSLFLIIPKGKEQQRMPFFNRSSAHVLMAFVGLLAYFTCLEYLGFIIVSFLLLTFLFFAVASKSWSMALISSSLTTALSYVLFELLLESHLPKGILGF